ncbi:MAG: class I SAM-dependent methyltransferase [Pseudomonadota bacterium]
MAGTSRYFGSFEGQDYLRCSRCRATFLVTRQLPLPDKERAHYKTHENNPDDVRYRAFLARLATPLLKCLPAGQSGLDYGCGPGPALAAMLREAGHSVALYDPFFAPDVTVLHQSYDFITCTEVAEHFHQPAQEFRRLNAMLRPGGFLGIMTMFQTDDKRFAAWHYRRDPTHVVFYRDVTMQTIAEDFDWKLQLPAPNVVIFQKRAERQSRPS